MTMRLGMNISGDFNQNQIFLNKAKCPRVWSAVRNTSGSVSGMGDVFNLDPNGYPTDMLGKTGSSEDGTTFTKFEANPMRNFAGPGNPFFKGGHWVFLWDGTADPTHFTLKGPGLSTLTPISSAQGRIVVDITDGTQDVFGILYAITGINGSNTVSNIRLVHEDYESLLEDDNEVFDPDYLALFDKFDTYRFMDWVITNDNESTGYPTVDASWVFWGNVAPVEVAVALCNKAQAHAWFCVPALVNNAGVVEMATRAYSGFTDNDSRVWAGLDSNLNCHVEFYNELFNSFNKLPADEMVTRGGLLYPTAPADYNRQVDYYICRSGQVQSLWKDTWNGLGGSGAASRVIRIGGMQLGGDGISANSRYNVTATNEGAYTFTANGSISGTTLTIANSLSGTIVDEATYGAGQLVTGAGVLAQTYIVSNISGSGNGSTWTVSKSHSATGTVALAGQYYEGTNGDHQDYLAIAPYITPSGITGSSTVDDVFDSVLASGAAFSGSISGTTLTVTAFPSGSGLRLYKGLEITSGAASGTIIMDQLTKSGSTWCKQGTYQVSISQTVAGGTDNLGVLYGSLYDALGQFRQSQLDVDTNTGHEMVCYEMGPSFIADVNTDIQDLYISCCSDSRMYTTMTALLTFLDSFGVPFACDFSDVMPQYETAFGIWGSIPNILTPTSDDTAQEYRALSDFIDGVADAVAGGNSLLVDGRFLTSRFITGGLART